MGVVTSSGVNRSATSPILVHSALVVVSLLFGANYVVAKFAFREVSPPALTLIRVWSTAGILFAVLHVMPRRTPLAPLSRSDLGQLFLFSVLGVSLNQLCFLEGLARSTATNAGVMLVSIPVLTLGFAVLLKRERATPAGVVGILTGLTGALVLILPRGGVDVSARATIGNLLLLAGGSSYSLYLVLTRPILARHEPLRVVSWVFLLAGFTVLPIGLSGVRDVMATGLSPAGWASVAYVTIGATIVPYLLNSWALVRVKASVVAVYILIQPIVAGALGRIFLHERLGPNTAIAAVLVIAGVVLSSWRRDG